MSRFAILNENIPKKVKSSKNEYKNEYYSNNSRNFTSFTSNKNNLYNDLKNKDNQLKQQEQDKKNLLSLNNFPELENIILIKNNQVNSNDNLSFMDKLKTQPILNEIEDIVKPGWILINTTPNTNIINIIYSNDLPKEEIKEEDLPKEEIKEEDLPKDDLPKEEDYYLFFKIFQSLDNLYKNYTNQYIENWGEDEWEKMFKFENYDYTYFDKLDELNDIEN